MATPDGDAVNNGYSLRLDVNWIYLNTSYTHRGVPQTVERFSSTEAPFHLLLLLDVSGSTQSYIDMVERASIDFTREIRSDDRVAVAAFNSNVRLIQDFTSDRSQLGHAIGRIRAKGGTAFYDALDTCIRDYMSGVEGRKAIVVFTDGVDGQLTGDYFSGSRLTFDDLYRQVQETEEIIYPIFLDTEDDVAGRRGTGRRRGRGSTVGDILGTILNGGTPPAFPNRRPRARSPRGAHREARRQLELIASQTGGRMYAPKRIGDLTHVFSEIADDLRIQYTLAYNSTNGAQDGRWRDFGSRSADATISQSARAPAIMPDGHCKPITAHLNLKAAPIRPTSLPFLERSRPSNDHSGMAPPPVNLKSCKLGRSSGRCAGERLAAAESRHLESECPSPFEVDLHRGHDGNPFAR